MCDTVLFHKAFGPSIYLTTEASCSVWEEGYHDLPPWIETGKKKKGGDMNIIRRTGLLRGPSAPARVIFLVLVFGLGSFMGDWTGRSAFAVDVSVGPVSGRLDTTISTGASIRVEDRDPDLVGKPNGGNAWSINGDDGNLNFDLGDLVSLNTKVTHELDLKWRRFGFFGRMYYFYDWAIMKIDPERTGFTENAKRRAGMNIRLLDAYVTGDFKVLEKPLTLRIGNQVLNWGESTFIQNGINVINPVDVSMLRVAGAELKEALLAVPMISLSTGLTRNLSVEGFYQLYWDNTEIEPLGTFFSTNDLISPGASLAFLKFGRLMPYGPMDYPLTHTDPPLLDRNPLGDWIPRGKDREPSHQGQGGVALRYFAPWLFETELGLYYIHYHSRLPLVSGHTGPAPDVPLNPALGGDYIRLLLWGLTGDFASTSYYFREFPEDIDLIGASFSTDIGAIGLAIQGEVSYRPHQPIQVDDVELLFSAFSPLDPYLIKIRETLGEPVSEKIFGYSQLGTQGFNQDVAGYRRKKMIQPQLTLTELFGPMLGADQLVLVGELGATIFPDLEDKDVLRYDGPGTHTSANPFYTDVVNEKGEIEEMKVQPETQKGGFADKFSWGYRLAARADFNNAIGPITLQPSVAFYHDVQGTTPLPIANFVERRKTITVGLTATYLNTMRATVSYTNYFGGGNFNLLHDRDFVSIAASVSF